MFFCLSPSLSDRFNKNPNVIRNALENVQYSRALRAQSHQFSIKYISFDLEAKTTRSMIIKRHDGDSLQKEITLLKLLDTELRSKITSVQSEMQSQLSSTLPYLEQAMSALNTVTKADLMLVKSMKSPPEIVRKVQQAVYILMNPPQDANKTNFEIKMQDFSEVRRYTFNDFNILDKVINYDKNKITPLMVDMLEQYIDDPQLNVENMKKLSSASVTFYLWIIAMYHYGKVNVHLKDKHNFLKLLQELLSVCEAKISSMLIAKEQLDPEARATETTAQISEFETGIRNAELKQGQLIEVCTIKLQYLEMSHIVELQKIASPTELTLKICFAALTLIGYVDSDTPDWRKVLMVLGPKSMLLDLSNFDINSEISNVIWKRIEPITLDESITDGAVSKQPLACGALWAFVQMVHFSARELPRIVSHCTEMLDKLHAISDENMTYVAEQETLGPADVNSAIINAANHDEGDRESGQAGSLDVLW